MLETLRSSNAVEVVGLVISTRVLSPRYGFLRGAWEQYRKSGLRYTVYLGCALARSLPAAGIASLSTRDINSEACRRFIAEQRPELLVSAFFNQRIGEAACALAPAVNIHPSLLPASKGVDPVFYASLRDAPLGVTLHRISAELDSGRIIAQQKVSRLLGQSVLAATVRLYALGAQILVNSLDKVLDSGVAQSGAGSYDSWPQRGDVAALRRKGVRLVRLRDLLSRGS